MLRPPPASSKPSWPRHDPVHQALTLGSAALRADHSGALYWPAERMLIVADLHLEKCSAFAARGQLLPPYDTRATLDQLGKVIARYRPATVIALGDSFHDSGGVGRLSPADARQLDALQHGLHWIWISGNHDPVADRRLGGEFAQSLQISGIDLRHEPDPSCQTPEMAGHLHPAARLVWNGSTVRARCFASDAHRIVLPAFGAFAGGLNLISEPFERLFAGRPRRVDMLGQSGIHRVPPEALVAD